MKCDGNCEWGEEASVFFSYIEEGKIRKVNLCKHCASENGVDDPTGYSLVDMLQGMGEETSLGSQVASSRDLTCEQCGFSQSDFKKTGRFGCANCYNVFSDGLESLLEAMHKNTEHIGKVPSLLSEEAGPEKNVNSPAPEILNDVIGEVDLDLDDLDELVVSHEPDLTEEGTPEIQISLLKDKLDVAVSNEDYEEAAKIRDEISVLENQVGE